MTIDDDLRAFEDDLHLQAFEAQVRAVEETERAAADPVSSLRLMGGGDFILERSSDLEARWGSEEAGILWACGESLLIAAPSGTGKTTIAVQLVEALIGLRAEVLGLPVKQAKRVLYCAMDRPRQIERAFRRRFGDADRTLLNERLSVLKGPLPTDLVKAPDQLLLLARKVGADVVVVDSLKDACAKLTDDESGSMVNRAVQMCNAEDIDVLGLHHQRKGQEGRKPNTLADVYGSTWITAGAGSVVLLWGEPGSEVVELSHLKQPADPVGPWTVEHDHHTGLSTVQRGFDILQYLGHRSTAGATVAETAQAEHGSPQPAGQAKWKRTERRLRRLVKGGLAVTREGQSHGEGGLFGEVPYHLAGLDLTVDTHRGQGDF